MLSPADEGTSDYTTAAASKMAYITGCRHEARDDLASAAAAGRLAWAEDPDANLEERDEADVP